MVWLDFDLEAPAIVFSGKRYYILMSHKTGYRPNNVVVFSAERLAGPWSIQSYIAPYVNELMTVEKSFQLNPKILTRSGTRTFNSQSTMTFAIKGTHETTILYCGDQWTTSKDLYESTSVSIRRSPGVRTEGFVRYIWLPADVNDRTGSFTVDWHDLFSIDIKTGKVTYPKGQTYEAEDGVVGGSAYKTICVSSEWL